MRKWFVAAAVILIAICGRTAASSAQNDPLPSWNNGATKKSITDFVAHVTAPGAAGFVPVPQRIATFDNDGTLWTEKPIYFQVIFALDRIRTMAPQHPEWKRKLPFKAAIDHDMAALSASGTKGLLEIVGASQGGLSPEEYDKTVLAWLAVARHPRFDKPYTDLVYQPMLELLDYLRSNGFKTFIASGGGADFMRAWTQKTYGIPPEQVVGSTGGLKFEMKRAGGPALINLPEVDFTMGRASPWASSASSAAGRYSPSAIPTATCKCCNGPRLAAARASWGSSTIPMPNANTRTTETQKSAGSTKHWTKRR
jgi:phosphoglycolate phosphatase-like HAD superfamily hydrolase